MKARHLYPSGGWTIMIFILMLTAACRNKEAANTEQTEPGDSARYLIAYNVYVPDSVNDDNYDLFVTDLNGKNKKNITNHPDVAWTYLAWQDRIFFISDRDTTHRSYLLYESDASGNDVRRITDFILRDSWMGITPDGKQLVVTPHRDVDSLLYIIDRKGNILQKLNTGTPYASNPAFSPDGLWIAFVGKNKASKQEEGYQEEIYKVRKDGSGLKKLTNYPENDTTAAWYAYKAGPPRWHPSGEFITYQSVQNSKYSLFAVTPDGSRQWKLTDIPWNEGWHDWSPDGKYLAVELFDDEQTQFGIGLMNWESGDWHLLTDSTYKYQQAPVFVKSH